MYYTSTVLYFTTLRYTVLYTVHSVMFGRIHNWNIYTKLCFALNTVLIAIL